MKPKHPFHRLDHRGTWRSYTLADGLASLQVEHIAEDADGYLWFATWDSGVHIALLTGVLITWLIWDAACVAHSFIMASVKCY